MRRSKMNATDYNRIKADLEAKRERALAEVEKAQEALGALEVVWEAARDTSTAAANANGSSRQTARTETMRDMVMNVLESLSTVFESPLVWRGVFQRYHVEDTPNNRAQVSGTLVKLAEEGVIELVHRGKGATPSRYKKTRRVEEAHM
jgi:hypothetical protein